MYSAWRSLSLGIYLISLWRKKAISGVGICKQSSEDKRGAASVAACTSQYTATAWMQGTFVFPASQEDAHTEKKYRKGDQLQCEEQQISLWIVNLENRSWDVELTEVNLSHEWQGGGQQLLSPSFNTRIRGIIWNCKKNLKCWKPELEFFTHWRAQLYSD